MKMIKTADEINTLVGSLTSTLGVYFVTAFSGLLAPYWDPGAVRRGGVGSALSNARVGG